MPVRVADNRSVDQLADAYAGARGVFVHLSLGSPADVLASANALVAALDAARPERVVISTSGAVVDDPESPVGVPEDAAVRVLIDGVEASGISSAVVAPRLFLENLLLPPVLSGVREEGVLRYPLAAGFPVSWSSHLDNAEVVAALFDRADVTGLVAAGQSPAVTGEDLAAAFAARLGRPVRYEEIGADAFGDSLRPLLGDGAATGVTALYEGMRTGDHNAIGAAQSAQTRLGLVPRTPLEWLEQVGV